MNFKVFSYAYVNFCPQKVSPQKNSLREYVPTVSKNINSDGETISIYLTFLLCIPAFEFHLFIYIQNSTSPTKDTNKKLGCHNTEEARCAPMISIKNKFEPKPVFESNSFGTLSDDKAKPADENKTTKFNSKDSNQRQNKRFQH